MQKALVRGDRRRWLVALNALAIVAVVAMASFTGCGGGDSSTNNNNNNNGNDAGDATTCTNTQTDPMNCGKCGNACMAGQVCSAGACASMCGANSTQCGQSCVDTKNDNANCGKCGTACMMGQVCSQGACGTNCGGGTKLCGTTCVDTNVDPGNCGGCGTKCADGKSCVMGACASICGNGQTFCPGSEGGAGYCANEQTDNSNCGDCGKACGQGQVCAAGTCGSSCGQGEKLCSGDAGSYCANTNSDGANCGDCGVVCGQGQVCQAGKCQNGCAAPDGGVETLCTPEGGAPYCADTNSDNANCGGCGVACGQGQVCQNGQCANGCVGPDGGPETLCTPDGGSPYCANTGTDGSNCGGCGIVCGQGQVCSNGTCSLVCGQGLTACGNQCVDTNTDSSNCGGCGNVCKAACVGGVCGAGGCLNNGLSPPAACTAGFDTETGSNWVVCTADCSKAWISANTGGTYHATQVCNTLGYGTLAAYGGTCGNVCGYCQAATTCSAPGTEKFDNAGNDGTDQYGQKLSFTVTWQCAK
jgi:hypothetical protein